MDELIRFGGAQDVSRQIVPIPKEIAQRLVGGAMLDGAAMVHDGDKSKIFRVFERAAEIPGIPNAKLRIDVRKWHVPDEDHHRDHVRFEYVDADHGDALVAEMHFQIHVDGSLELGHRYIRPDLRGKAGLGSRLYRQTESFFQQIANEKHHGVVVQMQMGQQSVIVWAKKMGFEVLAEYQSVLAELQDHPERFTEDEVLVSQESQSQGIVKDKYTFRIGTEGRYMEDAIRVTMKKVIQPAIDAVEK